MSSELTREEALKKLQQLVGKDLRQMATEYGITVFKDGGGFNKGWAGHVVEHYLGLPPNSLQNPDFGDWELKTVPVKKLKSGKVVLKETMAITMINPANVSVTSFEESHLYAKLRKMIVVARLFNDKDETTTTLVSAETFDFDDNTDIELIDQIKADYETVQKALNTALTIQEGFSSLTGRMGVYVQPRTKGQGHGSISRAFYMKKNALKKLLKLP